jgi:hypothetical protein
MIFLMLLFNVLDGVPVVSRSGLMFAALAQCAPSFLASSV